MAVMLQASPQKSYVPLLTCPITRSSEREGAAVDLRDPAEVEP